MTTLTDLVTTDAELDAIYGAPVEAAVIKEIDHIAEPCRGSYEPKSRLKARLKARL